MASRKKGDASESFGKRCRLQVEYKVVFVDLKIIFQVMRSLMATSIIVSGREVISNYFAWQTPMWKVWRRELSFGKTLGSKRGMCLGVGRATN